MKKTWIKIKRGFLQPEHRDAIGIRVWLYMFMVDQADWDTGVIYDWKDQNAADELGMPIGTLRQQRQELENKRYIDCVQSGNHQKITILKWVDPRSYSGEVLNNTDPCKSEGTNEGTNEGEYKGLKKSVPLHCTHIPLTNNHKLENHIFIGDFLRISEIPGIRSDYDAIKILELRDKYGESRVLQFAEWCNKKGILTIEDALKSAETALPKWKEKTESKIPERPKRKYKTGDGIVIYD